MSYEIEHGGLHELFYLDGVAATVETALQLLEEALVSQQNLLQESVADMDSDASDYDYALGDISVLKDAADDVRLATRRIIVARSSISARIS
ncbi:MAG: hypothetical protein F4X20_05055 [Dehalococcoidia bacterium]|nr:hypothetical protein [Dehalococcoidia bacterium]